MQIQALNTHTADGGGNFIAGCEFPLQTAEEVIQLDSLMSDNISKHDILPALLVDFGVRGMYVLCDCAMQVLVSHTVNIQLNSFREKKYRISGFSNISVKYRAIVIL